jgi:hypothetical protein
MLLLEDAGLDQFISEQGGQQGMQLIAAGCMLLGVSPAV